ncbi:HTH-type transcriptional activator RhaS [bioreactor metagenome]|uniref:HTH-type transcriptional activator RhaS n=1 Tax=bioreactor metagenome TaxID=1076179 RepID=A0A645DUV7_9ZZZZ
MDHIGKAESWYEVLLHLEEYFTRLRLLLEGCEGGGHSCISQVVQYLEQHYTENITLNDLAKLVHLSPAYLSRRFHQEQGMPIRDYITRKRMERARCLLQTSRFSIKEISESCGFSNVSHFYRICKEHTGLSPAQMRQQGPSGED